MSSNSLWLWKSVEEASHVQSKFVHPWGRQHLLGPPIPSYPQKREITWHVHRSLSRCSLCHIYRGLSPTTNPFIFLPQTTVTACNSSSSARSLIHGLPLRLLHRHPAATGRLRRQPPRPHQARRLHDPLLSRPLRLLRGLLRLPPAAPRPALPPLASHSAFRHQDQAPRRQVLHPPPELTPRRRSHLRRLPRRLGGQARGQAARQLLPCLPQGLHRQVGGHWPAHLPSVPSSAVAQGKRGGGRRCRVCRAFPRLKPKTS